MLVIKRPTESTIQYIVSTRAQSTTLTSHVVRLLVILTRIIGAAAVILATIWQYECLTADISAPSDGWISNSLTNILSKQSAAGLSSGVNRLWTLAASIVLAWLVCRRGYTEESLLVMRGLGVQTSTSSSSYLLTSSTRFIPTTSIQDIFIHEAFIGFKVKFYLSIVVENEDKVVVVFPNILPRLEALETIWRGARACLYDSKS